jgi:hypothetical protein
LPFSSFSSQPKVTLAKIKPSDKTHANFTVLTSYRCHSNGECAVVVGSDSQRGSPATKRKCCDAGIRGLTTVRVTFSSFVVGLSALEITKYLCRTWFMSLDGCNGFSYECRVRDFDTSVLTVVFCVWKTFVCIFSLKVFHL